MDELSWAQKLGWDNLAQCIICWISFFIIIILNIKKMNEEMEKHERKM